MGGTPVVHSINLSWGADVVQAATTDLLSLLPDLALHPITDLWGGGGTT